MIGDLRAKVTAAIHAYDDQDMATASGLDAIDTAIVAVRRMAEQNRAAADRTRVAYSFKGAMTQGGGNAGRAHDQIRDILENQLRALQAVRAAVERITPLVAANQSIAQRMLGVIGS